MPRRRHDGGATVESDSFLDIVANIVGILIILIVVAGVRVGQSTTRPIVTSDENETAVAEVISVTPTPPDPTKPEPVVAPRPIIVQLPPKAPEAPPSPSPVLLTAIESTTSEIEKLRAEHADLVTLSAELQSADSALKAQAVDAAEKAAIVNTSLEEAEAVGESLLGQLDDLRSELDGVGRQLADVPTEKVTVLRHRLNPIGREVQGTELHFRLSGNHIAQIPLQTLIDQLKPQVERQKEWISKFHSHQGRVGPVDGFMMEYVLERQRLSVVEELRLGSQMMRISVAGWKIVPGREVTGESIEEALRPDSRFMSALRLAKRDATLTFWVYPDSFEAYRRLQDVVHEQGLGIAARPLPHGVPIAGSPNGSRTSSQ